MNLVMMDVFPTLWSPKNTSLYFAKGAKLVPVAGLLAPEGAFAAAGAAAGAVGLSLILDLSFHKPITIPGMIAKILIGDCLSVSNR